MTQLEDINRRISELEIKLEIWQGHKDKLFERIDQTDKNISAIKESLIELKTIMKNIPEKVEDLEIESSKREGYVNALKIATGIIVGLIISYMVNNISTFIADKTREGYRIEKSH